MAPGLPALHADVTEADPRYVAARRVLLDALEALTAHRAAIIVAGAQAVYLRTSLTDLGIAPYTTDGDLALDPTLLGGEPALLHSRREAPRLGAPSQRSRRPSSSRGREPQLLGT